jgi:hypothetical protein
MKHLSALFPSAWMQKLIYLLDQRALVCEKHATLDLGEGNGICSTKHIKEKNLCLINRTHLSNGARGQL